MILVGCDPECFVFDKFRDGFISAHTLIPGTKTNPFQIPCGAIQRDGVAAEFNITPASSREEFLVYIRTVMKILKEMIGDNYELVATPTAVFDRDYFDSLPDTPKELGCTPDYSAYTRRENSPPGTDEPFRTGAGHVHIGWDSFLDPHDPMHFRLCCNLVKQLDSVLFFASLLWDNDSKRRELYGNIGAFRPKTYGLEYRPMSNAWLNDDDLILWVYDATVRATELFFEGVLLYEEGISKLEKENYELKILTNKAIISCLKRLNIRYGIPLLPERYRSLNAAPLLPEKYR